MGKECKTAFRYLHLDLKEHRNYISLDQTHIKLLDTVNLKYEKLSIYDTLQLTISKLIWVRGQTRPDISLDVLSSIKSEKFNFSRYKTSGQSHISCKTIKYFINLFSILVKFQN